MKARYLTIPILVLLLLAGCTMRFVSEYDIVTDTELTRLTKEINSYLIVKEIELQGGEIRAPDEELYARWKSEIDILIARAESIPLTKLTVTQLKLLHSSISDLQDADWMGFGSTEEIEIFRATFNSIFRAILKFERAKKREG